MTEQFDQAMTEFISLTMARTATADNGYPELAESFTALLAERGTTMVTAFSGLDNDARQAALRHVDALSRHAVAFAHFNAAATAFHYLEVLSPDAAHAVLDAVETIQADGPKSKAALDATAAALLSLVSER
jgi:hypothetical protein